MGTMREEHRVGIQYLEAVTAILRRGRLAHPTKGLYEPAELMWWWGETARSTDSLDQLFWFDDLGRPEAAVIITEWRDWTTFDPIVMPNATLEWVAHVVARGLAYASASGFEDVQLEVDRADEVMRAVLASHGFVIAEEGAAVESWLAAEARPEISPLHDGYRLVSRLETMDRPHHMIERLGPDVEQRLLQTPLYRSDLDFFIVDRDDKPAARGLCWYDPKTSIGVVEPMRTEDYHQRRGLARHILTTGIDRLVKAGAERIKIVFEPGNPASSHLYVDVGFEPVKQTDTYSGRVSAQAS